MPDMPDSVSKPSILMKVDQLTPEKMAKLLSDFKKKERETDVAQLLDDHGLLTPEEKEHIRVDWFNSEGNGWWPKQQPDVQKIIALGFMTAFETALADPKKPLPVDCYWVCCTGHHELGHAKETVKHPRGEDGAIEVAVLKHDRHVTVLVHTPGPGLPAHRPRGSQKPEAICVLAKDGSGIIGKFVPEVYADWFGSSASQ